MSLQSVVHSVVLRVVVVRSLVRAPSSPSSVLMLLQLVVGEVVRKRVRVAEAAVAGNAVELLHQAHLIAAASVEKVLLVVAPVLQDGRVGPAGAVAHVGETVHVRHAGVLGGVVETVH